MPDIVHPVGSEQTDRAPAPYAEVVAVPFLHGHIPCVVVDGEPMVILRPIAELIGLRWQAQHAKISADQTACVSFIVTQVPGDTQARRVMAVSLETFTVWLATLQPSRVRPEAQETVIAYKREAGRALRRHFFDRGADAGAVDKPLTEIEMARKYVAVLEREQELSKELEAARPKAEYVDSFVHGDTDASTIRVLANQLRVRETELRQLLVDRKAIYRRLHGRRWSRSQNRMVPEYSWHAYATHRTWFVERDQPEAPRHHNDQMRTTLYVTPIGKVKIAELVRNREAA
ncbi:phage antirepressor N-terminal domain-containing protein [Streptomyces synnematoformans]|uniref:Antirepressor protein C-terminal domain-containing protein n=1 Tax=Streptomyces synnematoformans TaxID=415721 RepID=A0ABN2XBN2_9ACTN